MTRDLLADIEAFGSASEAMENGARLLRGRALPFEDDLLSSIHVVASRAPFRHMVTAGGFVMSVAMTNCGAVGLVTSRTGYRYDANDPKTGRPWPVMPDAFARLAAVAAEESGYTGFAPDVWLINRYEAGGRLTLHQDKDESDFARPIVSVSLGLPATFQFCGASRSGPVTKYALRHGDVAVWGGPTRLSYHGAPNLKEGCHPKLGRTRINLTFRRAL
jgi:DNA oxidative demethylase